MVQYDLVAKDYSEMIAVDPVKKFAQRPQLLNLLSPKKNELILDIGCGDGTIARMVAKKGASVVGYDASIEQILLAKSKSKGLSNLEFLVSTPTIMSYPKKFDKAFAVMVLLYSDSEDMLQSFFNSTFKLLKPSGTFVILDCLEEKIPFGADSYGRTFVKTGANKAKITFSIPGSNPFAVDMMVFSKEKLESCAKKAGFKSIQWKHLVPNKEGIKIMGAEYWANFIKQNYWEWMILKK
ncbi:Ubiquinone/menaquinone biosynthesis C-methyltransferase UbiE [uncultured archaeon]|nr:Ubiquinone/menaquinone biosynthesis C-methyltransferase UbiE [uncultured archaeon]